MMLAICSRIWSPVICSPSSTRMLVMLMLSVGAAGCGGRATRASTVVRTVAVAVTQSATTSTVPATTSTTTVAPADDATAVRRTASRFNRALAAGHDRVACELMTDRGQRKLMATLAATSCEAAIEQARTIGASGLSRGNAPITNIKVTGDRATATSAGDRLVLARIDGRWLMDWK